MEKKRIKELIDEAQKCEYISFDIFDTLIKRNVEKPTDVFKIVELEYERLYKKRLISFSQKRIQAEKEERKKKEEITIKDIYERINQYSDNEKIKIKELEEETEIGICQINKDILPLYEWARNNKKIIIISDMYLNKDIISKILKNNGIIYYKLFISSEIGKRKKDGKLYEHIIRELNISPKQIMHIGDNKTSDIIAAERNGMKTFHYTINEQSNHFNYQKIKKDINYNIMCNFIKNNLKRQDYFYNVGYECFGPILFGLSKWILKEIGKEKITKAYFLARDGKIIKKAVDLLNEKDNIETYYFYASRRSIIVPSLWKYNNVLEMLTAMNIPRKIKIDDLKKRLGLDDIDISENLSKYNLSSNEGYDFEKIKKDYRNFLEELYLPIVNNSKEEYENFIRYKNEQKFEGKIAIVDIGWLGNMQQSINKILENNIELYGYYFGLRHNKKKNINSKGFLFDTNKNSKIEKEEIAFNAIFEFLFSATHGSIKRFVGNNQRVEMYPSENKNKFEKQAINSLQAGALRFIKDFKKIPIKSIELNEFNSTYNMFELLKKPSIEDANMFGEIKFNDGELFCIARKDKKFSYNSFKSSLWKIGYLRRNIKKNLPFDKIYKIGSFFKR